MSYSTPNCTCENENEIVKMVQNISIKLMKHGLKKQVVNKIRETLQQKQFTTSVDF